MLKNGTKAPYISLLNHDGVQVDSNASSGKVTVLFFHRGKFCPTTDRFLTAYQDVYGRLKELSVGLVAVSTDSVDDNHALAERFKIRYPLLSDPAFAVASQYGVYRGEHHDGRPFAEPALIVIDVDGKVAYSVISSGPKGLPSPGDVIPVLLYMHSHGGRY